MSNTSHLTGAASAAGPVSDSPTAEEQLQALYSELSADNLEDALASLRALKNRAFTVATEGSPVLAATDAESAETMNDPRRLLAKIRAFTSRIDSLNGTISSMESQLKSLYADRERLEREIGASEVDDVVAAFGLLQSTIRSMEGQLMTLYAGRETLEVELGKSDPTEIVAMFRNIAQLVRGVNQELTYTNIKN